MGIEPDRNRGVRAAASQGLDDIFGDILRPNKGHGVRDMYDAKVQSYAARWPGLLTIGWEGDDSS